MQPTSSALSTYQTPEEQEYARYLGEIETLKSQVAELESETAGLNLALSRFNDEYHARVGKLFIELDHLQVSIDQCRRLIDLLETKPDESLETLRKAASEEFQKRREEVNEQAEYNRQYEEQFARDKRRPDLTQDLEKVLKALYLKLAKRFHPDLGRTEEERVRRESVMKSVNDAFRDRDVETLRRIEQEAEFDDPAFEARSIGDKLVWSIREVSRLRTLIDSLRAGLDRTRSSELHELWTHYTNDKGWLDAVERELNGDIVTRKSLLEELLAEYATKRARRMENGEPASSGQ